MNDEFNSGLAALLELPEAEAVEKIMGFLVRDAESKLGRGQALTPHNKVDLQITAFRSLRIARENWPAKATPPAVELYAPDAPPVSESLRGVPRAPNVKKIVPISTTPAPTTSVVTAAQTSQKPGRATPIKPTTELISGRAVW